MGVLISIFGQSVGFSLCFFVIWVVSYLLWKFIFSKKSKKRPYFIDMIFNIAVSVFWGRLIGGIVGNVVSNADVWWSVLIGVAVFCFVLLIMVYINHRGLIKNHNDDADLSVGDLCKNKVLYRNSIVKLIIIFLAIFFLLFGVIVGGYFIYNKDEGVRNLSKMESAITPVKKKYEVESAFNNNVIYFANNSNDLSVYILNDHYHRFDGKRNCWIANAGKDYSGEAIEYCMKIKRIDNVNKVDGLYIYILAISDDAPYNALCHGCGGLVNVFVAKNIADNSFQIVSKNTKLLIGSWGYAPKRWEFIKLGVDCWGWYSTMQFMNQGNTTYTAIFLVPYGNKISDNYIVIHNDYVNMDGLKTDLNAKLYIDYSDQMRLFYPIISTLSGLKENKVLREHSFNIYFDEKRGYYVIPKAHKQLMGQSF